VSPYKLFSTINSHLPTSEKQSNNDVTLAVDANDIGLLLSPQSSLLEFHSTYENRVHYIDVISGTGEKADFESIIELKYTGMSDKSEEVWGRPKNSVCVV
jgi:hypothetical protein